ncbi:methylated-DNA--[protein]-cysteine S-methyltransferase [Candidatus Poribacteria bacterium]|nr:MAG: methylated-DNA--[protein]-cysteine S-methyltransferase [Candidatus Poribacteria bacterium]
MKRLNPLERISEALGGEQGLRQLRNVLGVPSFCYKSPIGWIDIIAEENRILRASFSEVAPLSGPTFPPTLPVLTRTIKLLDIYFAGGPIDFAEIPMPLAYATEFQQQVWRAIQQIPYGEVRSYQWIADRIGRPKSARSIGNAVGANPISILIPCHRVIRSNGALGGYGGGLDRKRQLLALEGHDAEKFK